MIVPSSAIPDEARKAASPPPAEASAVATTPLSAFAARKAEQLLRVQLPCLGCHALGGEGGRTGPDLSTVGARRSRAYIDAIIDDPQRTVLGAAMPKTPMTPELRSLLARYLAAQGAPKGVASSDAAPPKLPAPPALPPDGAALYARWCVSCHGERGNGDGPNARHLPKRPAAHADKTLMQTRPDDALYDVIAAGGTILSPGSRMPSFGATLSDAELRALVAHLRKLCVCEGPAWSSDGARR